MINKDTGGTLTENGFSLAHNTFAGWVLDDPDNPLSDKANVAVDTFNGFWEAGTYEGSDCNKATLTAKWDQIKVDVTLAPGDHGSGSASTVPNLDAGGSYTLPAADYFSPSEEIYTFDAWQYGTEKKAAGSSVTLPDENVTFTALWKYTNPVTITFDKNASDATGGPDPIKTYKEATVPTPTTGQPTRTNYTFLGWAETSTASTAKYDAAGGQAIDLSGAGSTLTLYGVWQGRTVHIDYDGGGGTGSAPETPPAGYYRYGGNFPLPACSYTKTGNSFTGWQIVGDALSVYPVQKTGQLDWSLIGASNSVTLTAAWAPTVVVAYDGNGGTPDRAKDEIAEGESITSLPGATRSGYTFLGWFDGTQEITASESSPYTPTSNAVLQAHWRSNNVTFKFEPGTGATGEKDDVSVTRGQTYTAPTTCTEFTKTNYVFAGWKNKVGGEDVTEYQTNNDTPDTVTLVAQWKRDAVTVNLKANGGTGSDYATTMYRSAATSLPSLDSTGITAPTGSVFLGWVTDTAHKTPDFLDGASIKWDDPTNAKTATTSDTVDLYALWQEQLKGTVTVKYKDGTEISGAEVKINDELKAIVTIEAPTGIEPAELYYRWRCGDTVLAGGQNATEYTVDASLFGKQIFCEVSNDPHYSCVIKSGNYSVSANATSLCDLTVTVTGGTCTVDGGHASQRDNVPHHARRAGRPALHQRCHPG